MIPAMHIIAWSQVAPWAEQRQVEQDLIISRALVELFSDPFLAKELRFRGGTAINKLLFQKPLRYSEDIDLVRTTAGPIRPILDRVHDILDPWMGAPAFDQSPVAPKLRYAIEPEDKSSPAPMRLKVEVNTREREAFEPGQMLSFTVANAWFSGEVAIPTFSMEELLATKVRALLQRNKGRDLIDLSHSLKVLSGLDATKIVTLLGRYLETNGTSISRAQAEQRMFEKLDNPNFMADVRPLLAADERDAFDNAAARAAFTDVFSRIIRLMPGNPWALTADMIARFELNGL